MKYWSKEKIYDLLNSLIKCQLIDSFSIILIIEKKKNSLKTKCLDIDEVIVTQNCPCLLIIYHNIKI